MGIKNWKMLFCDSPQSKDFTRYQKILWGCSFGWKNLFNFTCLTMKLHNWHHATVNVGSWNKRASKFPVIKVEGLKKKSGTQLWPHSNQSAQIPVCQGSNYSQSLIADNFIALWPTVPKFLELKDLNPFEAMSKVQEASSMDGFFCSKVPSFQ